MTGTARTGWHRPLRAALALLVVGCVAAACTSSGTTKTGASAAPSSSGPVTIRFATADSTPYDQLFVTTLQRLSQGRVHVEVVHYDDRSTTVDREIAKDVQAGKLDAADVASRVWAGLGVSAFRAFQAPFLVTSRPLLDAAVAEPVAAETLSSLGGIGLTGLALVPRGIRMIYSTRPLTSPEEFQGAVIRINDDVMAEDVLTALGAKVDKTTAAGGPTVQALTSGKLTGIEADVQTARVNGYVAAAPYVLTGAPFYAKTTTFVASTTRVRQWGSLVAGWVTTAAKTAAAGASASLDDKSAWAGACAAGIKPEPLDPARLEVLHTAESSVFDEVSATKESTLAADRIGFLATQQPRLDPYTSCGTENARSATAAIDGTYTTTTSAAAVAASGDCTTCGNDGDYTVTIHDGRYAIVHPLPADADLTEPSVSFQSTWKAQDPVEVGTITLSGNHATFVPETGIQFGALPVVYSFALFRGKLTWTFVSEPSAGPTKKEPPANSTLASRPRRPLPDGSAPPTPSSATSTWSTSPLPTTARTSRRAAPAYLRALARASLTTYHEVEAAGPPLSTSLTVRSTVADAPAAAARSASAPARPRRTSTRERSPVAVRASSSRAARASPRARERSGDGSSAVRGPDDPSASSRTLIASSR
jgi:TRAP-type C4-dicarboxylate transport system substrate-binding protein